MNRRLGFTALALVCAYVVACGDDGEKKKVAFDADCGQTPNGNTESRIRYKDARVPGGESCQQEEQLRLCVAGQFREWSGTYTFETCEVDGKRNCDDKPHASTETRTRYDVAVAPANGQCNEEPQTRECQDGTWSEWTGTYAEATCRVADKASCDDQPHGAKQTRTRYENPSVPFGNTCKEETQTRECNNGKWTDWLGTYPEATCVVLGRASCDGKPHGSEDTRKRYEAATVPFGSQCKQEEQTRTCNDGTWSAFSGTFTEVNCSVQGAANCGDKPHDTKEERVRHEKALVPFGNECKSETQTRQCDNGNWTAWTGSFAELTCVVDTEAPCNGKPHGNEEKRTRYQNASVAFGEECVAETQSRSCNNGNWSEWSGSYTEHLCAPAKPAQCDGKDHDTEETRTHYATASVPFGELCNGELQKRKCNNGNWSSWSGSFTHESCQAELPLNCGDKPHSSEETRKRYATTSVPFGETCSEEEQKRTCNNGNWSEWSGSFVHEVCAPELAPCDGKPHGSAEERERFQASSVPIGAECQSQKQTRTCNNGAWSSWSGSFAELGCNVETFARCDGELHGSVQSRKRYEAASVAFDATCKFETQTRQCSDGTWSEWTGTYTFEACTPEPDTRPHSCELSFPVNVCANSTQRFPRCPLGTRGRKTCSAANAVAQCTTTTGIGYAYPTPGKTVDEVRTDAKSVCKQFGGTYQDL